MLLVFAAITASAQNGRDIYNRYSEKDGVHAVYISSSMFRLMGKLPAVEMSDDDIDISELVKSLDGFYMIGSENPTVNENLKKDVDKFVNSSKYELLMEVKEDGTNARIYVISKGDEVTSLVMSVFEGDNCLFLCLDGRMLLKDIEKLLEKIN